MTWLREIHTCKVVGPDGYQYEPLWIHPSDAATRGIDDGDVVKIYNERGVVLAGAWVTERIRPGAVYIDHGARWDPIVAGELDRGGAINTITPHNITSKNAAGMVCSGFLVEVEARRSAGHPQAVSGGVQATLQGRRRSAPRAGIGRWW